MFGFMLPNLPDQGVPAFIRKTNIADQDIGPFHFERLKRDFKDFTVPLLIIHGTRDTVTRPEGSKEFFANAGSKDKTLNLYEGYFHDPLNDLGKEAVMDDIKGWIGARLPG